MPLGSKIFIPNRCLGYVSNHVPLQVRYIKSRKENLLVTCVGKSFHTYGISHFGLLSVSGLHPEDIQCMTSDSYHVYTACGNTIYAWRRGTELQHTYSGHKAAVQLMLPFGVHLIAVDKNSNVKIWDIKNESMYLELTFSNTSFQITAIMHPSTYINKVLFASDQGTMQLWNINTAKLVYTFRGWDSPITCVEQAPAIDVVAVGLYSGKIILHNLKFDETIMEFTQDWGAITSISFRTDEHPIMATGSTSGHIVFWNLEERRVATQLMNAHEGPVTGLVCLPSEPLVVTSSPDNSLKLWIFDMTDDGARLLRIREGHSVAPTCIRYHGANGHNILSAAGDSSLRIFNTQTEQFNKSLGKASYNRKISKKKHRSVVDSLKMPPIMEFTSETTREKEWDNIAALHGGLSVVTSWSYNKLKMGEFKFLPDRLKGVKTSVISSISATSLCLTHCGNFVLIGYSDGFADRFNIQSGLWRDTYGTPKAHNGPVRGITTDNLNQITITGGSDLTIKFWRFNNKGEKYLTVLKMDEPINFFRSHHESSMLAVALEDFTMLIVDIDTRVVVRKFEGHTGQLTDATFSPDSRWLVSSAMDCTIRTWDIPAAQLVDQFQTESACISLNMSPTGESLATAHVDYLGIFLWCNRTLYTHITFKALSPTEHIPAVVLPEVSTDPTDIKEDKEDTDEPCFISPEQIGLDLITLSGLASSRWLNLLNIDIIRKRNKPKAPPKAPKAAPFFLPTIPSLTLQFDIKDDETTTPASKLLISKSLLNLSEFGKILEASVASDEFEPVITKLKSMGPSLIEFEIQSLAPEGGGSVSLMLQFLKCIECMLRSNQHFELAQAYLAVFLKSHGNVIATEINLQNFLPNLQNCHSVGWNKMQENILYSLCIVENLKTM